MELKHKDKYHDVLCIGGFNRTFMELKHIMKKDCLLTLLRFNRTFMELKHRSNHFANSFTIGLIVPLWN